MSEVPAAVAWMPTDTTTLSIATMCSSSISIYTPLSHILLLLYITYIIMSQFSYHRYHSEKVEQHNIL